MGLKIATIGGGSSYTPELIEGFIKRHNSLPVSEIWLVDIEEGEEKLNIVGNLARRMVKNANVPITIHTTLNRQQALEGADFVTTQIRVGMLDARIKDESIPLSHGMMGQETNGAGGQFKGLRTIPVILSIIEDMKRLCPNAFLVNFANPVGMVTEAVFKYANFPKFVGLCNGAIGMERSVASMYEVEPHRIRMVFAGLNHMVFGLKVFLDGVDITKKTLNIVADPQSAEAMTLKNIPSFALEKDFVSELGVLPISYLNYYFKRDEMLKHSLEDFAKGTTRGISVQKLEKELFELYKDENLLVKPKQLEQRGGAYYSDAACSLIDSIYNDRKDIQTVNTQNKGAISNFSNENAVEVSSIITKDGPVPMAIGNLPTAVSGIVAQIKAFETIAAEAAVEGNYKKALLALCINPLTASDTVAKIVLDELLEAHKKYLPNFFK